MRKKAFILGSVFLCVALALVFVIPVFASTNSWWNSTVDVKVEAKLDLYKGSYWASWLRPSNLSCNSAVLTVGNVSYVGKIKAHWWIFRSCDVTFQDIPADVNATLNMEYYANGNRSYQKSVYIGKTWWNTIRLQKVTLPWWEE